MAFHGDDEQLEAYLRQFHPRAPSPLPDFRKPAKRHRPAFVIVAAAAAMVLAGFAILLLWQGQRVAPPVAEARPAPLTEQISLMQLNRVAQQHPEELDAHLDRLSSKLLPDVNAGRGVLKQLARE